MTLQEFDGCDEILIHCRTIALPLHDATFVVVAGVTAQRGQRVWCKRNETGDGKTPSDIFDIGIEAAVFVNDDDTRQSVLQSCGPCKISPHDAGTLRRCIFLV